MNQPETFQEWRNLWHQLARELGFLLYYNLQDGLPVRTREVWRLCDQMRRVYLRLQVEAEAGTSSYCQAMLDAIFTEDDDRK